LWGFVSLVAGIAAFSTGVAAIGLLVHSPHRERPDVLSSTTQTTADVATPEAAAAVAKGAVERSRLKERDAKVVAVTVKRVGRVAERPRYEADVVVEAPLGPHSIARSEYLVTLQYAPDGKWDVEGMETKPR
jgi:hypothetical protein